MPTKDDVFNYVMKTPENTNPAVLKDLLDGIEGGGGSGDTTPDWNANEGEPGYILNRPFYYEVTEPQTILDEELEFIVIQDAPDGAPDVQAAFDFPDGIVVPDYPILGDSENIFYIFTLTIDGEKYVFDNNTPIPQAPFPISRVGDCCLALAAASEDGKSPAMVFIGFFGRTEDFTANVKIDMQTREVAKKIDENFISPIKPCMVYVEQSGNSSVSGPDSSINVLLFGPPHRQTSYNVGDDIAELFNVAIKRSDKYSGILVGYIGRPHFESFAACEYTSAFDISLIYDSISYQAYDLLINSSAFDGAPIQIHIIADAELDESTNKFTHAYIKYINPVES